MLQHDNYVKCIIYIEECTVTPPAYENPDWNVVSSTLDMTFW